MTVVQQIGDRLAERDCLDGSVDGFCLNSSVIDGDPTNDAPGDGSHGEHAQYHVQHRCPSIFLGPVSDVKSIARDITQVANADAHPWVP
jgi:hypothetical protein